IDSANVTLTEPPPLFADILDSTMVTCNGLANGRAKAVGSGGTGSYTYLWDDPTTATADSVVNLDVDTFTVTITDSLGCTAQDSVIITEPDVLVASNGLQMDVVCFSDSTGMASANITGGTPPYTYSWNTVALETDTMIDSLFAGSYTITVQDSLACNTNFTFIVIQPLVLDASFVDTLKIECFNDTLGGAVIEATGGVAPYTIVWTSIADTSYSVDSFWVDSLWAGKHFYEVTDAQGCTYTDSILLLQPIPISPVINVGDGAICVYGTDSIQASASGGTGILTYSWDNNLGTGTSWKIVPGDTTRMYHLSVTDENGCSAKDSVEIIVHELIRVGVSADTLCIGDSIGIEVFMTSGKNSSYSYVWDFGDGVIDTTLDTNASHIYTSVGWDLINLVVLGPDPCVTDSLSFDTLIILASPMIDVDANPLVTTTTRSLITFLDITPKTFGPGENVIGWYWTFGDGDSSFLEDDTHLYLDSGTYSVTHAVINEIGCTDTMVVDIRINPSFEIEIPNAFTPDPLGANGGLYDPSALNNNIFYPTTKFVETFHMTIFNRWGEMVYESFDVAIGWDGYYRGVLSQQDVYVWKIELQWINGDEFKQIGDLTLVR
ncbi:MAG: gliding motility-associated C-terminal domain-containing protein, partial [Flavobacteriales bacterium]|nr:gliding motility-associated C-terminal domain-containing protein [Flavobacteriales bacterium]